MTRHQSTVRPPYTTFALVYVITSVSNFNKSFFTDAFECHFVCQCSLCSCLSDLAMWISLAWIWKTWISLKMIPFAFLLLRNPPWLRILPIGNLVPIWFLEATRVSENWNLVLKNRKPRPKIFIWDRISIFLPVRIFISFYFCDESNLFAW